MRKVAHRGRKHRELRLALASAALVLSAARPGTAQVAAEQAAGPPALSADAAPPAPPPAKAPRKAPASPSAQPAQAGSATRRPPPADVRVNEKVLFQIHAPRGTQTPKARAAAAEEALGSALDGATPEDVRAEVGADGAVIFVGNVPVVQLYPEDAALAGDASLEVHAATLAAHIRDVLRSEQKRTAIASTVLSFSLAVFCALLALYLARKVGELAGRARAYLIANPERIPALRLQSIEVIRPALLRGAVLTALSLARWLVQLGILYGWLVFALSLFESTREYTEQLTGFVLAPVSALFGRLAASLPVLLVLGIAGFAVYVLVRFVGLFFAAVARGETALPWLPADLAPATSVLLRFAIIAAAIVFGAPVVTGDSEGALARSGSVVVGALALASTPLLASAVVGSIGVFLRRLRVGEFAEFGGRTGRVLEVGLLDVRLEDAQGCELRVPHLLSLFHPTKLLGTRLRIALELSVAPSAGLRVRERLLQAAAELGERPALEVLRIEPSALWLRISLSVAEPQARATLEARVLELLSAERGPPPR